MRKRHFAIAASISLLSACGNSGNSVTVLTPDTIAPTSGMTTITDATSDYKEICINGTVYYKSRDGGGIATLSPKIVIDPRFIQNETGLSQGYHVPC